MNTDVSSRRCFAHAFFMRVAGVVVNCVDNPEQRSMVTINIHS